MGAQKAKPIQRVESSGGSIWVTYYDGLTAQLDVLPRAELMSLSAKLDLGTVDPISGAKFSNGDMIDRVRAKVNAGPEGGYNLPVSPLKVAEYEAAANVSRETFPAPAPAPAPATVPQNVMDALGVLTSALGGGMNADAIRDVVDEHLATTFADRIAEAVAEASRRPVQVIVDTTPAAPPVEGLTHAVLPHVLALLGRRANVALIGPAGTGKSFLARQAAQALGLDFYEFSCSSDAGRHNILGYTVGEFYRTSQFRQAYEHGGLFLLDEADRADTSVMVCLNGASSAPDTTFDDGVRVPRHPDFRLVLAMNTFGDGADARYVAAQPIDASVLNRYVKVHVTYDRRVEAAGAAQYLTGEELVVWLTRFERVRENVATHRIERVTGTRDAANGAMLVSMGLPIDEVFKQTCLYGLSPEQFRKCMEGVE